jgi:hypothetical protein
MTSGSFSISKDFKEGIKMPILTLELMIDSPILNMDCEGCNSFG